MLRPDPEPVRMIPFPEIVTPEVHETPDAQTGIVTVCPSVAVLIAVCTSDVLHEAAVT